MAIDFEAPGANEAELAAATKALADVAWKVHGVWDHAIDGTGKPTFTGLAGRSSILIIARGVSKATSAFIARASTDNGATYYTANGTYLGISSAGVESAQTAIIGGDSGTSGRSWVCQIDCAFLAGVVKPFWHLAGQSTRAPGLFVGSTDPINAIYLADGVDAAFSAGTVTLLTR